MENFIFMNLNFGNAVAPLVWVPWVPRNPSIFEQWVPEPINYQPNKPKIGQKTVSLYFAIPYCYLKCDTDLFLLLIAGRDDKNAKTS